MPTQKTLREILNNLATAYRKYPLKEIEDTEEVNQAISEIKSLLEEKLPKKAVRDDEPLQNNAKYLCRSKWL